MSVQCVLAGKILKHKNTRSKEIMVTFRQPLPGQTDFCNWPQPSLVYAHSRSCIKTHCYSGSKQTINSMLTSSGQHFFKHQSLHLKKIVFFFLKIYLLYFSHPRHFPSFNPCLHLLESGKSFLDGHQEDGARPFCSQYVCSCVLCSSGLLNQPPDEKTPHRTCSYANRFRQNLCCHRQCHCQASFYFQFSLLNKNMGTDMFLVCLTEVWLFEMRTFLKFSPICNLMYIFFLEFFFTHTQTNKQKTQNTSI